MSNASIIAYEGFVITTANANLRQGTPIRQATVLRKVGAGTSIPVIGIVIGEAVMGNAHWFKTDNDSYVWAGACGPLQATPSPVAENGNVSSVVRVVDLYQEDVVGDFTVARSAGLVGVIHKATTGETGRDDAYHARRDAARAAGLLWGAYHWGTARPVDNQLNNFLQWANPDDQTLVALDYEPSPGNQMTLDMARDFLRGIEVRLGRKAVLYSGHLIKDELGNTKDNYLGSHRLWLAQYGAPARVQGSWTNFWLWQYTDGDDGPSPRVVPGIVGDRKGRVDCNHYGGGEDQLRKEWAAG